MRRSRVFSVFIAVVVASLTSSCGSSDVCSCSAVNGAEQRAIVCGESACLGGTTFSCTKAGETVRGAACVAARSGTPDAGSGIVAPPPPPDTSCQDLQSYCSTSCSAPANVAADCVTTASSGDSASCASWTLSNGVLCHP